MQFTQNSDFSHSFCMCMQSGIKILREKKNRIVRWKLRIPRKKSKYCEIETEIEKTELWDMLFSHSVSVRVPTWSLPCSQYWRKLLRRTNPNWLWNTWRKPKHGSRTSSVPWMTWWRGDKISNVLSKGSLVFHSKQSFS